MAKRKGCMQKRILTQELKFFLYGNFILFHLREVETGEQTKQNKKPSSISTQESGGKFFSNLAKKESRSNINHSLPLHLCYWNTLHSLEKDYKTSRLRKVEGMNSGYASFSYYTLSSRDMLWKTESEASTSGSSVCIFSRWPLKDHMLTASSPASNSLRRKWKLWEVAISRGSLSHWDHCLARS